MPFQLDWLELVCPVPACRGELDAKGRLAEPERLICMGCNRSYPVVFGIPDLRLQPDPYISFEGDLIKAEVLAAKFHGTRLRELAEVYYHFTPETPAADVVRNLTRLSSATERAKETLAATSEVFGVTAGGTFLEVGCGTAPMLLAAKERFSRVAGFDVALRWLIIAKRRLADAGVSIPLVAANGESLPVANGCADVVMMDSYLEITQDASSALREAHRALTAGGRLLVSTPNRLSPGPDPHIGLPGGSWLPRAVVDAIAKQRMARPPLRHLYSAGALNRSLRAASFTNVRVAPAPVAQAQMDALGPTARAAARQYNRTLAHSVGRAVGRWVAPLLLAEGTR